MSASCLMVQEYTMSGSMSNCLILQECVMILKRLDYANVIK